MSEVGVKFQTPEDKPVMPMENQDRAEIRVSAGLGCRLPEWPGWRAASFPVCLLGSAAGPPGGWSLGSLAQDWKTGQLVRIGEAMCIKPLNSNWATLNIDRDNI